MLEKYITLQELLSNRSCAVSKTASLLPSFGCLPQANLIESAPSFKALDTNARSPKEELMVDIPKIHRAPAESRPAQTYQEALAYLYSYANYEQKSITAETLQTFDLARVKRLLGEAHGPSLPYLTIHVAGTKGKGSTSAMVESILRSAGHRTGLFTSPHLHSFRERIQVNGAMIAPEDLVAGVNRLAPTVRRIPGLTTFEIATVLALAHFAQEEIDIAVVEVGLGGRLDATNIIEPLVAAITSISYDHTQVLGNSLQDIAQEKAGIIKRGAQVVSAPQRPEVMEVIREVCGERGATLRVVGQDWTWDPHGFDLHGQTLSVHSLLADEPHYENLWIPLLGEPQLINAATAVAITELIARQGVRVPRDSVSRGLRSVRWPGRMEILSREPLFVVDGAHNGHSARQLTASLRRHFGHRPIVLIFGASAGKDISGMFEALLPEAHRVIITRSHNQRAVQPKRLRELAEGWNVPVEFTPSVEEAVKLAARDDREEKVICATGSLFLVGEVREVWLRMTGQSLPYIDPPVEAG